VLMSVGIFVLVALAMPGRRWFGRALQQQRPTAAE
jgi:hypothetical protein